MSVFDDLLDKINQREETRHKNINNEIQAALECLFKFEKEYSISRTNNREKALKDRNLTTTRLQSIDEDTDEQKKTSDDKTVQNGNITDDQGSNSMDSDTTQRRPKKRSKNEVEGIVSPELDKRQKRNASVRAQTIISKQVNVNLTQKLRREESADKTRASRRKKDEDNKENDVPIIPLVNIKPEKISIPPEPMDTDSIPLDVIVKQEPEKDMMPPPSAPLPKSSKAQKQKEKEVDKETEEDTKSRRTTRMKKQTDVESMPPPQAVPSSRATRASARASSRNTRQTEEEEPPLPVETRPKRTRAKKKVSESSTESEIAPTESATASPIEKPRPKRTRRAQKAAEREAAQKQDKAPLIETQKLDKLEKAKEPVVQIEQLKETPKELKESKTNSETNKTHPVLKETQSDSTKNLVSDVISVKEEKLSQTTPKSPLLQKPKNNKLTKQDSEDNKKTAKSNIPKSKKQADVVNSSEEIVQDEDGGKKTANSKIPRGKKLAEIELTSEESVQDSDDGKKTAKSRIPRGKKLAETEALPSQESIQDSDDGKKTAKPSSKIAKATSKSAKAITVESQSSEDLTDSEGVKKTIKTIGKIPKAVLKSSEENLDEADKISLEETRVLDKGDKINLEETRILDKCNTTVTLEMDRTVVLPNGVYNHVPVTPQAVCNGNVTVVLEKCKDLTSHKEKHAIMNSTVVLDKVSDPKTPEVTDDNPLIMDDSSEAFETPPRDAAPKTQPSSAVKEKVQKFEELATRTTRTKTRAMAKIEDNSTPPDKIIKPVMSTESLNKMNNLIFNGKVPQISSSACKPRVVGPAVSRAASASKASAVTRMKEAAEDARMEKEDAIRKKEALLEARREAHKRRREEKMAAAAAARAATEEQRRRLMEAQVKERQERQAHADMGKMERLKEVEKKKLELARKVAETEERRKAEEQARVQRLAEEQKRAEAARKKQLEEQALLKKEEAKMAKEIEKRQKEYLDKQKMKRSEDTKSYTPLKTLGHIVMDPTHMEDGFQYLISDEEDDSSDMPVPQWSISKNRRVALSMQAGLSLAVMRNLFTARACTPDLRAIFPSIERRKLARNSSAVWRTPPRLGALTE